MRDYNHYRTVNKKLNSTNNKAVSIVTSDIYDEINEMFIYDNKEEPKCKYSKPAVAKLNSIELDYNGYNIFK